MYHDIILYLYLNTHTLTHKKKYIYIIHPYIDTISWAFRSFPPDPSPGHFGPFSAGMVGHVDPGQLEASSEPIWVEIIGKDD